MKRWIWFGVMCTIFCLSICVLSVKQPKDTEKERETFENFFC